MKENHAAVVASVLSIKEIERGITRTGDGFTTPRDVIGCGSCDERCRALLLTIGGYVRAAARTAARDRSIEILYRPSVRVTFLDGCS